MGKASTGQQTVLSYCLGTHAQGMTERASSGTQRPFDWVTRWWLALCCPDHVGPGCIEQVSFCLLSCGRLRLATCWRIPASYDARLYPSCPLLSFCILTATTLCQLLASSTLEISCSLFPGNRAKSRQTQVPVDESGRIAGNVLS